jgi:nitroreductase
MSLQEAMHWRYAAKRMNGQKVAEEHVEAIIDAARYAPTSMGLQPFSIIVIENAELRAKIRPLAWNQPQITEASHLLLFAAWTNLTEQQIDEYLADIMATRGVSRESLDAFKASMMNFARSPADKIEWAARQAYIAMGFAMAEAALLRVDSTPMEGFRAAEVDALLGLPALGLTTITLLPLGYRDEANDFLASSKKVRRSKDKLVIRM